MQAIEISQEFVKLISEFLSEAIDANEGIYILSNDGRSRCAFVITVFLMTRYASPLSLNV